MRNIQRATAAICLTVFGSAFLVIAGLWPEDTPSVWACAVIGWLAMHSAYTFVRKIDE
ncbi:membrane protein [Mycobacterium phage Aegeus]|nr:membrane protein [Mycobacterium phage Baudelaire]WKW86623.1 membrane protein [Mycobacterium phage Aegeus]